MVTDPQQHPQTITATWDQSKDGTFAASIRVYGLSSESQAKADLQRMRAALSERQQALPPILPHDHPEPQVMVWSEVEIEWIKRYASEAVARALAASAPGCVMQDQEGADDAATMDRMADLLTRTANALRGDPGPLRRWSWHDLPERVAAAIAAEETKNA